MSPFVIGLVVILSPSSKAGDPEIKPVILPSRFCFQLTTEGTPAGALAGAFFGAGLAFGLGLGLGLAAAAFLAAGGGGDEVLPPAPPKSESVWRGAGGVALGAGAGAGADLAAPPPKPPKRLMVAPGAAFSTDFLASVAAFFWAIAARFSSASRFCSSLFAAAASAAALRFASAVQDSIIYLMARTRVWLGDALFGKSKNFTK